MAQKDFGFGNGITTLFSQALSENAEAMLRFDAMTETEKRAVLARARKIESMDEMKAYIDTLVGCEKGHPPYQL